jgi:hypothetical protein
MLNSTFYMMGKANADTARMCRPIRIVCASVHRPNRRYNLSAALMRLAGLEHMKRRIDVMTTGGTLHTFPGAARSEVQRHFRENLL